MKTKIFTLFFAVMASISTMYAERVMIGNLYYILNDKDKTAEVTYQWLWSSSNYSGLTTIDIPAFAEYNSVTYSVTSIGGQAFEGCIGLKSVTIPNSVTGIGNSAFSGCTSLTTIEIPNSVTSIGWQAFAGCIGLKSIEIPNSVTNIEGYAFYGCTGLPTENNLRYADTYLVEAVDKSLFSYTIKEGTKWVGTRAFEGCTVLTSIEIPNSVKSIGYDAFYGCTSLPVIDNIRYADTYLIEAVDRAFSSYTITEGTKWIGGGAFSYCTSLTSIEIPNSVTNIEGGAFDSCCSLISINIPNSVTNIGDGAFSGCTSLPVIDNIRYADTYLIEAVDRALSSYTITEGTKWIGGGAFSYCTSLTSIEIPNSVTSIGGQAFYECRNMTTVTIDAETPPSLGYEAFNNYYLTSIYVPCGALETYQSAENWNQYKDRIRHAPSPYSISVVPFGNGHIKQEGGNACEPVEISAIPDEGYHFTQWNDGNTENPRYITLTQDTTFAATFAADRSGKCGDNLALTWEYDDTNKSLTISGNGTLNSNYTFGVEAPQAVEKLIIAEGVTTIGNSTFAGYTTIKHISVPTTVKTIYEQAFYNCTGLEQIYSYREKPCVTYSNSFDGIDKFECVLHVLSASVDKYKAATGWRDFYYIETIDAEEITEHIEDVIITPTNTTAGIIWPFIAGAVSYEIVIRDFFGNVIYKLTFNASGHLIGIAFAPNRNYKSQSEQITGFHFTVTGLESGTEYNITITAKDADGQEMDKKNMSFHTNWLNGIEELHVDSDKPVKVLMDGQIYILRGEHVYDTEGKMVK